MAGVDSKDVDYIVHRGRVSEIRQEEILVILDVGDSCSSCHIKGACGLSDNEDKVISVPNDGMSLQLNELVNVKMKQGLAFRAILLAYLVPFVILISFLLIFLSYFSEWQAAVLALCSVGLYYLALSQYNGALIKAFSVQIERHLS